MGKNLEYEKTDVTILAAPFGFGPLGKALAIANEFKKRDYSVKILSDHTAQEIIKSSDTKSGYYNYREPLSLPDLNTSIVLSCLDISTPITKANIPLVLIDPLLWLRGKWERTLSYDADLFLAQRFFEEPLRETVSMLNSKLHYVDAILPSGKLTGPALKNDTIVLYPGGMRSPYLNQEYQEQYFLWSVDTVSQAILKAGLSMSDLIVITPPQLKNSSASRGVLEAGGIIDSGSSDLTSLIAQAKRLIIAPGIEITLEAYSLNQLPYFLPAFNGTHIPQLFAFKNSNIGKELCPSHLRQFDNFNKEGLLLSELSKKVQQKNSTDFLSASVYKNEAVLNLTNALIDDTAKPPIDQFPLGRYGARQVVDHSLELLRRSSIVHERPYMQ